MSIVLRRSSAIHSFCYSLEKSDSPLQIDSENFYNFTLPQLQKAAEQVIEHLKKDSTYIKLCPVSLFERTTLKKHDGYLILSPKGLIFSTDSGQEIDMSKIAGVQFSMENALGAIIRYSQEHSIKLPLPVVDELIRQRLTTLENKNEVIQSLITSLEVCCNNSEARSLVVDICYEYLSKTKHFEDMYARHKKHAPVDDSQGNTAIMHQHDLNLLPEYERAILIAMASVSGWPGEMSRMASQRDFFMVLKTSVKDGEKYTLPLVAGLSDNPFARYAGSHRRDYSNTHASLNPACRITFARFFDASDWYRGVKGLVAAAITCVRVDG